MCGNNAAVVIVMTAAFMVDNAHERGRITAAF